MKNKRNIIIVLIILLIILAAGIFSYLYLKTDMLKTNKQLFYKYLLSNEMLKNDKSKNVDNLLERISKNNNTSSGNIQVSYGENEGNSGVANLEELFKINYESKTNYQTVQKSTQVEVFSNNQSVFNGKFTKDGNLIGIFLNNVTAKYLSIENSNLKTFFANLGVENLDEIPDSIPEIDVYNLLKIDNETLEKIKSNYMSIIEKNINEEHYSKSKNQDETLTLSLSLTDSEVLNIEKALLENAKNDDTIINLIISKANYLNYSISSDTIKNKIQDIINNLSNTQTYDTEAFKLEININNNMVKSYKITSISKEETTEINVNIDSNTKITVDVLTRNSTQKTESKYNYIITIEDDGNNLLWNVNSTISDNQKNMCVNLQMKVNNYLSNNIKTYFYCNANSNNTIFDVKFNIDTSFTNDVQIDKLTNENSAKLNSMPKDQLMQVMASLIQRINVVYGNQIQTIEALTETLPIKANGGDQIEQQ